jgi:GT2 family glycosyltransferase
MESEDPIQHFLQVGWKIGLNPSLKFNTNAYLEMYQDVLEAELNPLVHYLKYGKKEKRKIFLAEKKINNESDFTEKPFIRESLKGEILQNVLEADRNHVDSNDQIKLFIDNFFDLNYEFNRFKQRPLIRIANYFDGILPENGRIQMTIKDVIEMLVLVRDKGIKVLILGFFTLIKKIFLRKIKLDSPSIFQFEPGKSIKLTNENFGWLIHHFSNNPVNVFDCFVMLNEQWDDKFLKPSLLIDQLKNIGARIFYVQIIYSRSKFPEIELKDIDIFLLRIPINNHLNLSDNLMATDNLISFEKSFFRIKSALNIHSAIMVVESIIWRKLCNCLHNSFGWKLVYNQVEKVHKKSIPFSSIEEKMIIKNCDLVLVTNKSIIEKQIHINPNMKYFPQNLEEIINFQDVQLCGSCSNGRFKILTTGLFFFSFDSKNFEIFIDVAKAIRNYYFVIIGNSKMANKIQKNLTKNIHMLIEKESQSVNSFLNNFDICILFFNLSDKSDYQNFKCLFEHQFSSEKMNISLLNDQSKFSELFFLDKELKFTEFKKLEEELDEQIFDFPSTLKGVFQDDLICSLREYLKKEIKSIFPKISIIIVTFNNLQLTKLCLESIFKNTAYPNYEICIVDNNSSDGTEGFLNDYRILHKEVKIILNNQNLGFAAANNLGVQHSQGYYVVFLNNDTLVTPGWLHNLSHHLIRNNKAGMVGPVTNAIGNEAKIEIDYSNSDGINYFAARRSVKYFGVEFEIKVLALFCSMISRELFLQLGGLDEQFRIGMFEDDDLAMKIKKENLVLICAEDVFIHHYHGASFKKLDDKDLHRIFNENKAKFEKKWGEKWIPHQNRS